jgi:hypothetical protein
MEASMVNREVFDWGVVLTTAPFAGSKSLSNLTIRSEISVPRGNRGSVVKISFTGATIISPMDLTEASTWGSAMTAIISESRSVVGEMKAADKADKAEPKAKAKPKAKK